MARQGRKKSTTGIYHVMLRGIDKRKIFIDDEDREVFLSYLTNAKGKSKFIIYGYCLMDNHVHILLKEGPETIGNSIKRITVGYVQWHNLKYSRTGHLFQNRYKSENIEDDIYLLTALRYIHQNPKKAGLVENILDYKWSSYKQYIDDSMEGIVNIEFCKDFFRSQNELKEFMEIDNTDQCLEDEKRIKYTDESLKNEALRIHQLDTIKNLSKEERDNIIRELKRHTGASNRQLSRVLGIGRGIIERV